MTPLSQHSSKTKFLIGRHYIYMIFRLPLARDTFFNCNSFNILNFSIKLHFFTVVHSFNAIKCTKFIIICAYEMTGYTRLVFYIYQETTVVDTVSSSWLTRKNRVASSFLYREMEFFKSIYDRYSYGPKHASCSYRSHVHSSQCKRTRRCGNRLVLHKWISCYFFFLFWNLSSCPHFPSSTVTRARARVICPTLPATAVRVKNVLTNIII